MNMHQHIGGYSEPPAHHSTNRPPPPADDKPNQPREALIPATSPAPASPSSQRQAPTTSKALMDLLGSEALR